MATGSHAAYRKTQILSLRERKSTRVSSCRKTLTIDKRTCKQRRVGDEERGDGDSALGGKKGGYGGVKGNGPLKGGGNAMEVAGKRVEGRASALIPQND